MADWWGNYTLASNGQMPGATSAVGRGLLSTPSQSGLASPGAPSLWNAATSSMSLPPSAPPNPPAAAASPPSALSPLLNGLRQMRQLGDDAGSDVLTKATGPDYSQYSPLLPDTAGPTYQTARSLAQHLNPFSDVDASDAEQPLPYDEAPQLNAKLRHIQEALSGHVNSLGTSDADQSPERALVLGAMKQAIHAPDPETFFSVLHQTENQLRARAGMSPLPDRASYLPEGWARPSQTPYYVGPLAMKDDAGNGYYRGPDGQLVKLDRATQRGVTRTDRNQGWVFSSVPQSTLGAR